MSMPVTGKKPGAAPSAVSSEARRLRDRWFLMFCLATASVSVIVLLFLLSSILIQGLSIIHFDDGSQRFPLAPDLITHNNSSNPAKAGLWPALWGTVWTCLICALFSMPIGVGTAILLEEFAPKKRVLRWMHALVKLNIANLAGVPSIVYGILALTAFAGMFGIFSHRPWELGVRYYDQFETEAGGMVYVPVSGADAEPAVLGPETRFLDSHFNTLSVEVIEKGKKATTSDESAQVRADSEPGRFRRESWYTIRLPFGKGMLTGGLTLMLVVLPIVIIASQEALRAVPSSMREGALGLGATPWQVVWNVTLPSAIPGIMTGSILAMSRAIGEAAPILIVGGAAFLSRAPDNLMADFTVMPLQIFTWTSYAQKPFHVLAAAGILVLLAVLLTFNAVAVYLRYRAQRTLS